MRGKKVEVIQHAKESSFGSLEFSTQKEALYDQGFLSMVRVQGLRLKYPGSNSFACPYN